MVNAKWPVGELWDEDSVDTIEAVILDSKGVYSSLIRALVIVMHEHRAELQLINQAHVRFGSYHGLSIIIFRSLYQELKREEDYSSVAICAASVSMQENGCWSPIPLSGRRQLNQIEVAYDGVKLEETDLGEHENIADWVQQNDGQIPSLMIEICRAFSDKYDRTTENYVREFAFAYQAAVV